MKKYFSKPTPLRVKNRYKRQQKEKGVKKSEKGKNKKKGNSSLILKIQFLNDVSLFFARTENG